MGLRRPVDEQVGVQSGVRKGHGGRRLLRGAMHLCGKPRRHSSIPVPTHLATSEADAPAAGGCGRLNEVEASKAGGREDHSFSQTAGGR